MTAIRLNRDLQALGIAVRFHRRQAGLTLIQLAELAGVGKTVVFDIEHGKASVRLNTLLLVLDALSMELMLTGPLMATFKEKETGHGTAR